MFVCNQLECEISIAYSVKKHLKLLNANQIFCSFSFHTKKRLSVCADPKKGWVKRAVLVLRYGSLSGRERCVYRVADPRLAGVV